MINEKEIIEIISDLIKQDISTKLKEQGHNNTGSLLNSISYKITQTADSIITDFYMNNYGNIVDFGVRANRIPYRRGSGAKKSKYIDGLINYFQSKGLSDAESKRAAFATATIHKREGMPTKASSRFSKNGERTGFVTKVIDNNNNFDILSHEFMLRIDNFIDEMILNLTNYGN
jgi:hypothetical protein